MIKQFLRQYCIGFFIIIDIKSTIRRIITFPYNDGLRLANLCDRREVEAFCLSSFLMRRQVNRGWVTWTELQA